MAFWEGSFHPDGDAGSAVEAAARAKEEQKRDELRMDCEKLFCDMFPGFFDAPGIKSLPEEEVFAELVMDLRETGNMPCYAYPDGITFGIYKGDAGKLREAVALVDRDWVQYFQEHDRVYCAFDGDRIVSFCILDDFGRHEGLHIGGPGCVGTVPDSRRKGIGLEMVRRATEILKEEGFDLSWIHYTHVGPWYEKLGYRYAVRWNRRGIVPD